MTLPRAQRLTYHQVDAFTDKVFAGNPAAIYVLDRWLTDATLAAIAAEHNLSETAFVVPGSASRAHLRWFTPTVEVELCGHATLASAHVLLRESDGFHAPLVFTTKHAGELIVHEQDGLLWLDLPARPATAVSETMQALENALGAAPGVWLATRNYLAVFDHAADVAALDPDMSVLKLLTASTDRGIIATAPADADDTADFVSRYFAPGHGVDEDPVTGSAHCTLAPYWAERLGRTHMEARQISRRGGRLSCVVAGDRVHVGGQAVTVARGELWLPADQVSR